MPAKITGYTVHTHYTHTIYTHTIHTQYTHTIYTQYTHTIYTHNIHTHAMKLKVGMIIAIVPNSTAKKKITRLLLLTLLLVLHTHNNIYRQQQTCDIFHFVLWWWLYIIHTQNISQLSDTNYYCVWYTQGAMKEATGTWKSLSVSEKKVQSTYAAVLGRNRTFCCIFQSCHCLWSAVVQSLC